MEAYPDGARSSPHGTGKSSLGVNRNVAIGIEYVFLDALPGAIEGTSIGSGYLVFENDIASVVGNVGYVLTVSPASVCSLSV